MLVVPLENNTSLGLCMTWISSVLQQWMSDKQRQYYCWIIWVSKWNHYYDSNTRACSSWRISSKRLQTKHWELAVARWEQNSNKWRPGKWEDESFMAALLSYFSEPAHLQSKPKADEPGSRILWAPWALLLPRDGREGIHQPPSLGRDWVLSLEGFQHTQDQVLVCSVAEEPKHWLLAAELPIPAECNPSSSTLCPAKTARKI